MNTAVALAKLGATPQFLGRLSTDAFGQQLRTYLESSGVGLDLATDSSQATSIAVVSVNDDGAASYTFHFADTANFGWRARDLPQLQVNDWLHIASLSCVIDPGAQVLLDWVNGSNSTVSYDINVRPTVINDPLPYWAKVQPWLRAVGRTTGIVKASDEDINFLVGDSGNTDPVKVASSWVKQYGLGLAVVTLGANGVVAIEPSGTITRIPGFPTTVVDTVGAGDTFMASFLDARIRLNLPLAQSLRRGAAAAAIVCSRQGAQPPTSAEVDHLTH